MRKITEQAVEAFLAGEEFTRSNTEVWADGKGTVFLMLFGNLIARREPDGQLFVRTRGYDTVSTRDRLNGLPGVDVYRKKKVLHLNGKPWISHENWTKVS